MKAKGKSSLQEWENKVKSCTLPAWHYSLLTKGNCGKTWSQTLATTFSLMRIFFFKTRFLVSQLPSLSFHSGFWNGEQANHSQFYFLQRQSVKLNMCSFSAAPAKLNAKNWIYNLICKTNHCCYSPIRYLYRFSFEGGANLYWHLARHRGHVSQDRSPLYHRDEIQRHIFPHIHICGESNLTPICTFQAQNLRRTYKLQSGRHKSPPPRDWKSTWWPSCSEETVYHNASPSYSFKHHTCFTPQLLSIQGFVCFKWSKQAK